MSEDDRHLCAHCGKLYFLTVFGKMPHHWRAYPGVQRQRCPGSGVRL